MQVNSSGLHSVACANGLQAAKANSVTFKILSNLAKRHGWQSVNPLVLATLPCSVCLSLFDSRGISPRRRRRGHPFPPPPPSLYSLPCPAVQFTLLTTTQSSTSVVAGQVGLDEIVSQFRRREGPTVCLTVMGVGQRWKTN